ncbi:MAG: hypothetical protein P4L90_22670 [Rhodopila sp.]|nr:hypothetical protein [Rhodopila sp.]
MLTTILTAIPIHTDARGHLAARSQSEPANRREQIGWCPEPIHLPRGPDDRQRFLVQQPMMALGTVPKSPRDLVQTFLIEKVDRHDTQSASIKDVLVSESLNELHPAPRLPASLRPRQASEKRFARPLTQVNAARRTIAHERRGDLEHGNIH